MEIEPILSLIKYFKKTIKIQVRSFLLMQSSILWRFRFWTTVFSNMIKYVNIYISLEIATRNVSINDPKCFLKQYVDWNSFSLCNQFVSLLWSRIAKKGVIKKFHETINSSLFICTVFHHKYKLAAKTMSLLISRMPEKEPGNIGINVVRIQLKNLKMKV